MSNNKKMELPSISKKKLEVWAEAEELYTVAYNQLSQVVTGVGLIVSKHKQLPESVDMITLSKMVASIEKDSNMLRGELNAIHVDLNNAKANLTDLTDINMYCIVHAGKIDEWVNKYESILLTQFHDLTDYVEEIKPNAN